MEITLRELSYCYRCETDKPLDKFWRDASNTETGVQAACCACLKLYREENKEKIRQCRKDYYLRNTAKVKAKVSQYREANMDYVTERKAFFYRTKLHRMLLYAAKKRAYAKGIPFNIDIEDILIPELCPVFGVPLKINDKPGPGDRSPTLDRKITKLGYIKGNVHVISWRANRIKSDATLEEIEAVARYMRQHGAL